VPALPISETDVRTTLNSSAANRVTTTFDKYGNTLAVSSYDFGGTLTSPTGALLSTSTNVYGMSYSSSTNGCTAYASGFINNTPCYTHTANSAGDLARTEVSYNSDGKPASISRWTGSSENTLLTTSFTYGTSNPTAGNPSAGVVASVTDVNGQTTTYSNFVCNGMVPSTINYPLSLSTSLTWDTSNTCSGGVVTEFVDANSQAWQYSYNDPLWRITSSTDPLLNVTNFSYPSATQFENYMNFNGSTSTVDTLITTDGIGRPILVQRRNAQGATTFDSVQLQYGWTTTGAFTERSQPYSSSSSPAAWTTTQLDALGRALSIANTDGGTVSYTYSGQDVLRAISSPTIQKQLQYNGLGQLTSVCEMTSASGSGTCSQTTSQTGYWAKYGWDALGDLTSVTQNAQAASTSQQTRTYTYDGLGRLTDEVNPESGTTQYFWDAMTSNCGSYATTGDLGTKLDNAGNYTCYGYDALHRLLGFGTVGNSNCTGFVYDAPPSSWPAPSGSDLLNTKGRLIEAYTNSTCNGHTSIVTDRWLGYSARGEIANMYSSMPNSNGYYDLNKQYWANGVLQTLSGIPGVPTISYGVDGEGRWNTVTASSGPLVSATSYNSASQVTGLTFETSSGSGTSDSYAYDPDTGRMTQYEFTTNGESVIGNLTWNTNGTLNQLQISQDPFNSSNVQTCTYGYDALDRVSSVGCGSEWAQAFSYDPFGNITKSGSISWACAICYNESTNQYNSTLSSSISYDADGRLLNDTFYTYQWDPQSHMIANGTSTLTYDALGHMAEASSGDDYLYDDTTDKLLAGSNSQAAAYFANIPLPGGAIAGYSSGSLTEYNHSDWLGSVRFSSTPSSGLNYDLAFAPFGEPYASSHIGNIFAGMEQVVQPDLYDTDFREYHTVQGRWVTPDPAGLAAVDPTNPQTWNRYAYVINNPLSYVDPMGLYTKCDDEGNCFTTVNGSGGDGGGDDGDNDGDDNGGPPPPGNPGSPYGSGGGGQPGSGGGGRPPRSAPNNGQTPQQAATQYCQQHGQLSFNIPFTNIPVTISLSTTLGPANYSATNDISAVFPVIPWPEWLSAGASVDVTVNAPAEPSTNPNVGLGKNLSIGYFTTPNGPQGLSISVGPSVGPPINISIPANNACGMLMGGNG